MLSSCALRGKDFCIMFRKLLASLSSFVVLSLSVAPSFAQSFSVTDLGVVSGASYSYPNAINDSGGTIRIVGYTRDSKGNFYHGFYWDSAGGIKDLGVVSPGTGSNAIAVSSVGEAVGWASTVSNNANQRSVYRNFGGGGALTQLPFPALTYDGTGPIVDGSHVVSSSAGAINESHVVTGTVYRQDLGVFPVYWLQDGSGGAWQCHYFPQLPGSLLTGSSAGPAINDAGDAAGSVGSPTTEIAGGFRAVFWQNLGTPAAPSYGTPVDSGLGSEAACAFINSTSVAAGGYGETGGRFIWTQGTSPVAFTSANFNGISDANTSGLTGGTGRFYYTGGASRAFLADSSGGFLDLGVLSNGTASQGNGINSSWQVVGWCAITTKGGQNHAFLWASGLMKDLNSLTTGLGAFSYLSNGDRISNNGNIAGEGILQKGGATHACLLRKF